MKSISNYRGCLLGGAAGDALGYAVEFMSADRIFKKYGESGITEYELRNGVAQISDDTQMTLFTANGLLLGTTRGKMRGASETYPGCIAISYKDWLRTQFECYPLPDDDHYSWLVNMPELFNSRAPGHTCVSAIRGGCNGTIAKPVNFSKGCGGVMRVAPIGLYRPSRHCGESDDMIGAQAAALTHGHELGYIPAAALVHIISLVSHEDISLLDAVNDAIFAAQKLFAWADCLGEFTDIMNKAVALARSDMTDLEAIRRIGEGWVAEECLAIAVYCALKYDNDFDKALIAAVNHSGDSDSTGAVTGNILGAYLGAEGIPQKYLDNLELRDVIVELADDLYYDCQMSECSSCEDEVWEKKYVKNTYKM